MRKLESFDSRLVAIENSTQGKGIHSVDDEVESMDKKDQGKKESGAWLGERVTRQKKVEFPNSDGSRIDK